MTTVKERAMRLAIWEHPDDPRHGTVNGYRLRCRCERCREANRVRMAEYLAAHPEQREKHRLYAARRYVARPKPLPPCGTKAAFDRHQRRGEACEVCWVAIRGPLARRRGVRPPCGTSKGYRWHCRFGETPCEPCKAVERERGARRRRGEIRNVPIPHGTAGGYINYACRCDECREAHRQAKRVQRQARQGRAA